MVKGTRLASASRLRVRGLANSDVAKLGVLIRYQTTHERAFHRSLKGLQNLRKERRNVEIGFELQVLALAQQHAKTLAFLGTLVGNVSTTSPPNTFE